MNVPLVRIGRHAIVPKGHPLYGPLRSRLTIPNPKYQMALNLGKEPVEKKRDPNNPTKWIMVSLPTTLRLYEELGESLLVPRALAQEWRGAYPMTDERVQGERVTMRFLATLRPYQIPFVDDLCERLSADYGVTGTASAGAGKTVCAAAVMARQGVKTLVLVHKEFLMTQWIERFLGTEVAAAHFGIALPEDPAEWQPPTLDLLPSDIGIVQQAKCEWRDRKVVLAMAQSLSSRDYEPSFYEAFGLVIVDETHRFAAPTFQQTIVQFPAAQRLGLTATVQRADGLEDIFLAHIGPVGAEAVMPRTPPRVYQVKSPVIVTPALLKKTTSYNGRPDYVKTITALTEYESRNRWLVKHIYRSITEGGGQRHTIVFSHRVEHLDVLKTMLACLCADQGDVITTAFYIGGMKLAERKAAEKAEVIFATYAMGKEGLDIPALNTLVMATPIKEVEQLVGRIQRRLDAEKEPVVVDPLDRGIRLCENLAEKRYAEYKHLGWTVHRSGESR